MTRSAILLAVIFGIAISATPQTKQTFPAWITKATYVYVTTVHGDPFSTSAKIPPEDRQAASDVQTALQKWGRFTLVYHPQDAEIILVVRKGRLVSATMGGIITGSSDPRAGRRTGIQTGVEGGTPDDALLVYDARSGTDGAAALRYIQKNGLNAPEVKLLAQFRRDFEQASAKKP